MATSARLAGRMPKTLAKVIQKEDSTKLSARIICGVFYIYILLIVGLSVKLTSKNVAL